MLHKLEITDVEQFDKLAKDARSIVIYGSRYFGRMSLDYLIETGNHDKIAAIVHTKGSNNYLEAYRQIPIQEASVFFAHPEHKAAFVIVSVGNPNYRDEIFEMLENYGVQTSAYLDQAALASLLAVEGMHSSDIRSFIFTEGQLCDLVDHAKEVVIYSTGERGDRLVHYLERIGRGSKIMEHIRLIQETSDMYSMVTFPANPIAEDALVLVALDYRDDMDLAGEIRDLDFERYYFCTAELMEKLFVLLKNKYGERQTAQEMQFVVAGFPKCGTTSLHYALQRVEDIYLPDFKESGFFSKAQESSENISKEKWLRGFYSHVPKGSISGCVEPTFVPFSKEIRDTLGPNLKICFLMRNPIKAIYSWFKMLNFGGHSWFGYDQYGNYRDELFDNFVTDFLGRKNLHFEYVEYANILEEFLRYYPMEQIKVVIFEELIREPGEAINEILRFVGSKEIYDPQLSLPKENTGDFVWADQEGMMLAMKRDIILREKRESLNWHILDDPKAALARANELENGLFRLQKQLDAAKKIYNPKMTPEQRKRLEDFYRPSVRKLEKMLGKDLSKLWFE